MVAAKRDNKFLEVFAIEESVRSTAIHVASRKIGHRANMLRFSAWLERVRISEPHRVLGAVPCPP